MSKILVAKEGFNALTETDPDNFVFHSDFDTLKYDTQGIITVSIDLSDFYAFTPGVPPIFPDRWAHYKVGSITHNVGYIPYFAGYIIDIPVPNAAVQAPFDFADAGAFAYYAVYADATKLYFETWFNTLTNSGTFTVDFSYRIFKNDLGL